MKMPRTLSWILFVLLMFGLIPSLSYNRGTVSFSLNQTHTAQAFQSSFGIREDYSISTDYYVDIDHGDRLCSYLTTETITGSYCSYGWSLCGESGIPSVSRVWTGYSICVPY